MGKTEQHRPTDSDFKTGTDQHRYLYVLLMSNTDQHRFLLLRMTQPTQTFHIISFIGCLELRRCSMEMCFLLKQEVED